MSHPNGGSAAPSAPVENRPPESLPVGDGLSLCRRSLSDVAELNAAVRASLDHLGPWMPWAQSEPTIEASTEYAHTAIAAWDAGTDFQYVIRLEGEPGGVVGGFGLHGRIGPGALEIGYWVHVDHIGRGIATGAARALTEAAFALDGIERVEIHCDETNLASAAVPRKLGYRLDRVVDSAITAPAETGRKMIWVKTV